MTDDQRKFFALVTGPALAAEQQTGLPAAVTIAQAILESGWGKSRLFLDANNPFGIKATHPLIEEYGVYTAPTKEFTDQQWHTESAPFQKFPQLSDAFRRHSEILQNARYGLTPDVLQAPLTDRIRRTAIALQLHGYATDPHYSSELLALVAQHRLDDSAVLSAFIPNESTAGGTQA